MCRRRSVRSFQTSPRRPTCLTLLKNTNALHLWKKPQSVPHAALSSCPPLVIAAFVHFKRSHNGSGTVARTRHTDWRPTDTHTSH